MPTYLRALLLAVVFTVLPVGIGVVRSGSAQDAGPPAYVPQALAGVDTTTMPVARAAFCDRLPAAAVEDAIGTTQGPGLSYRDGDRTPVGSGAADVVDEFGCTYDGEDGTATAWVFAPPITVARAKTLVASSDPNCLRPTGAPAFGHPTAAALCGETTRTATFHGLFGDAWLSCSVSAPRAKATDAELLDRAGKWCVAVAKAAAPR